ncbi:hypothetical protein pEaSNUABM11_00189 [Erwinia phage pEa_SNUABM_11]|nr:hypothetical protein pEaSNUABM11_00189 [Erwinia phage pEa_SNUABM_11]
MDVLTESKRLPARVLTRRQMRRFITRYYSQGSLIHGRAVMVRAVGPVHRAVVMVARVVLVAVVVSVREIVQVPVPVVVAVAVLHPAQVGVVAVALVLVVVRAPVVVQADVRAAAVLAVVDPRSEHGNFT